jgi:hypothetical protein
MSASAGDGLDSIRGQAPDLQLTRAFSFPIAQGLANHDELPFGKKIGLQMVRDVL